MTDPYSVLGIAPGADDEAIKKAYRQKCKQYHPDLHPNDPAAEEKFKEVQAAYSEIMRLKQGGGQAGYQGYQQRQSSGPYGYSQGGYGNTYQQQDPFGGFGFGPFGFGFYRFECPDYLCNRDKKSIDIYKSILERFSKQVAYGKAKVLNCALEYTDLVRQGIDSPVDIAERVLRVLQYDNQTQHCFVRLQ